MTDEILAAVTHFRKERLGQAFLISDDPLVGIERAPAASLKYPNCIIE
jgi:hypothetical protein